MEAREMLNVIVRVQSTQFNLQEIYKSNKLIHAPAQNFSASWSKQIRRSGKINMDQILADMNILLFTLLGVIMELCLCFVLFLVEIHI